MIPVVEETSTRLKCQPSLLSQSAELNRTKGLWWPATALDSNAVAVEERESKAEMFVGKLMRSYLFFHF